mgnify:CR=1 FL=1
MTMSDTTNRPRPERPRKTAHRGVARRLARTLTTAMSLLGLTALSGVAHAQTPPATPTPPAADGTASGTPSPATPASPSSATARTGTTGRAPAQNATGAPTASAATATGAPAASNTADLAVEMFIPGVYWSLTRGVQTATFQYGMRIYNRGSGTVNNATFAFAMDPAPTKLKYVAGDAKDVVISGGRMSGTIPSIAPGKFATVGISGVFPSVNSTRWTATVAPPAGVADSDPSSNRASDTVTLDSPLTSILTMIWQDKETTAPGEDRVYTMHVENRGFVAVPDARLLMTYSLDGAADDTTTATVECAGRHACPTWADGKAFTVKDGVIFDRRVALKARSELVIKVTIRTQAKCTAGQKITVTNKVFVGKGKGVDVAGQTTDSRVGYIASRDCSSDTSPVTVTKEQGSETVATGQGRHYELSLDNPGAKSLLLTLRDAYKVVNATGERSTATVSCLSSRGQARCPKWADGKAFDVVNGKVIDAREVLLPAKSNIRFRVVVNSRVECAGGSKIEAHNSASVESKAGEPLTSRTSDAVKGYIACNDVSTATDVRQSGTEIGTPLGISAVISNSAGVAENVAVETQIPSGVAIRDQVKPTCAVTGAANGGTRCPADLAWDPARRKLKGTVPSIAKGESVRIGVDGVLGMTRQEGAQPGSESRSATPTVRQTVRRTVRTTASALGDTKPETNASQAVVLVPRAPVRPTDPSASASATPASPSATSTPASPSATSTPASPSATSTPASPSATSMPASPSATSTSASPSATSTPASPAPSPTGTGTADPTPAPPVTASPAPPVTASPAPPVAPTATPAPPTTPPASASVTSAAPRSSRGTASGSATARGPVLVATPAPSPQHPSVVASPSITLDQGRSPSGSGEDAAAPNPARGSQTSADAAGSPYGSGSASRLARTGSGSRGLIAAAAAAIAAGTLILRRRRACRP